VLTSCGCNVGLYRSRHGCKRACPDRALCRGISQYIRNQLLLLPLTLLNVGCARHSK
jgi:hypothetical protein